METMLEALRLAALRLPGTAESIACAGTALEKRTVTAGGKAFLFVGRGDVMLKLKAGLPEAALLPGCKVGAHGWVTLPLAALTDPTVVERWLEESFRLVASRKLVAELER